MRAPLLILALLVVAAALLYSAATSPYRTLSSVQPSDAAALSAERKLAALVVAEADAHATGRARPVSVTFTDDEITSLVDQQLAAAGVQSADHVLIHATPDGHLEGTADGHLGAWTFPVYVQGTVAFQGLMPVVRVDGAHVGRLPMPVPLEERVQRAIDGELNLGTAFSGFSALTARLGAGTVTLSGVAQP